MSKLKIQKDDMVSAIGLFKTNILASAYERQVKAEQSSQPNYSQGSGISSDEDTYASSIDFDYRLGDYFEIQKSTQNGIALINVAQNSLSGMKEIAEDIKAELNALTETSTTSEYATAQENINTLLGDLYELKNGTSYDGASVFGKHDYKPSSIQEFKREEDGTYVLDEEVNEKYINSAQVQIGFEGSENSVLEFDTTFSIAGFNITVASAKDLNSAHGIVEALVKNIDKHYSDLETNKTIMTQNYEAASNSVEGAISFAGSGDCSALLNMIKSSTGMMPNYVSMLAAYNMGLSTSKYAQIMSKIWDT